MIGDLKIDLDGGITIQTFNPAFLTDSEVILIGVESDGVWLPDSFGYSAALPQIAAAALWAPLPAGLASLIGVDATRLRVKLLGLAIILPFVSNDYWVLIATRAGDVFFRCRRDA